MNETLMQVLIVLEVAVLAGMICRELMHYLQRLLRCNRDKMRPPPPSLNYTAERFWFQAERAGLRQ